ncbi:MAG: hypothetical protein JWM40_1993 [Frankiales bacterium]|nr:hypothetical protein [Frankiales bacterium]
MTAQIDHLRSELSGIRELMVATPYAEWELPSACWGFTVRDVVAHLGASRRVPLPSVLGSVLAHGLRINAAAYSVTKKEAKRTHEQLLEGLARASADPRARGISAIQPMPAMLGEVVTHHEDIRWGLGARRTMPSDLAHEVLSAVVRLRGPGTWGTRRRAKGLSLHATDVDWRWGEGPLVSGTADALLLALGGRSVGRVELRGDGVPRLHR